MRYLTDRGLAPVRRTGVAGRIRPAQRKDLSASLLRLVTALEATDLVPGPVVDGLFGALVSAALSLPPGHPVLGQAGACARVRALCARGEGLLEAFWARRVVAEPAALRAFPYLGNYRRLVSGEWGALTGALGRRPRRVAFVGSGPLPLSALLIRRRAPGVTITCIDRDADALALGREVAAALCRDDSEGSHLDGKGLHFVEGDAAGLDYAGFDAVVLAALVGDGTAQKRAVLEAAAATVRDDAVLAVRSVPDDGRLLLYPRLEAAVVPGTFRVLGEWTPPPSVINSLLLLRRGRPSPDSDGFG